MKERDIVDKVRLDLSHGPVRLFRNNVGLAWMGRVHYHKDDRITIYNPRPVRFGLCVGSSDLIGWQTITITPDMVGKQVAVFVALEGKAEGRGQASMTPEQRRFLETVRAAGGTAGWFRGVVEAIQVLRGQR